MTNATPRVIDGFISCTPLVQLRRVVEPGMAEIWVKLEAANPGGDPLGGDDDATA